uniref:Uncharacterized protein n=1 Tax=Arion vulgaris TaxID=1028688 RepID=A0A0B7AHS4_9EUPU
MNIWELTSDYTFSSGWVGAINGTGVAIEVTHYFNNVNIKQAKALAERKKKQ